MNTNGSTQPGWGLVSKTGPGFMERYADGEFRSEPKVKLFELKEKPFAFVMRGLNAVAVDVDGKNGGQEHASELGALPYTLAEVSKSGTGHHVIYSTDDDWSDEEGFGEIPDKIGIVQGVDIRATGCLYHHHSQRWNNAPIAPLPDWLRDKLMEQKRRRQAQRAQMRKISTLDEMERLMAHSDLVDQLAKPIPAGKRNTTLFALAAQMVEAEVPKWDEHITARGIELKLSPAEIAKIVENAQKYKP